MNKQTLQNIAQHTSQVSNTEIEEIKQLIGTYPYYPLPHVVLAKIYFEKSHYLFENALNQAAMRVNDREWLYHYIHGDKDFENANASEALTVEDSALIAEDLVVHEEQVEAPIEPEETSPSDELLKNDLEAFLSDLENAEHNEGVEPEVELTEPLELERTDDHQDLQINEQEEEEVIDTASEIEIEQEVVTPDEPIEVFETEDSLPVETTKEPLPDMDLRKHPVYNVESFLNEGKSTASNDSEASTEKDFFYWLSHPKPEVVEEKSVEEAEEETITEDKTLSIIEQFIKANPSISRPKKEFYSAENMAKRSENLDFDFVSETLANIYYEQGNIDLAIKAYEKLSLQNPLKQTYFASLIEKIKKEKR